MSQELEELLNEVRLLFHHAQLAGEELHAGESVTMGMRGVMELVKSLPMTVPEIARARFVSRQHIQGLVNDLIQQQLVVLKDNPAHRRSGLVTLTTAGEQLVTRMKKRERRYLDAIRTEASASDILRATKTLRRVREAMGGRA
jgi:DNA-binding MarR family transcriptional regulator